MIAKFVELNKPFDGTLNHFHMPVFSSDISSNKVFTYKEAMTHEDKLDFVTIQMMTMLRLLHDAELKIVALSRPAA